VQVGTGYHELSVLEQSGARLHVYAHRKNVNKICIFMCPLGTVLKC